MIRKALNSDYEKLSKYYSEFEDNGVNIFDSGPFVNIFVYEKNNQIIGFISYSIIYDRTEINYIYVEEKYRRQNIANELMQICFDDSIAKGCKNITLEVNCNNDKGISLYKKFGFNAATIRPNYYHGENGLLMIRELNNNE